MRVEWPHRVWGGSVLVWPSQASCTLDCWEGKPVNSCAWRRTAGQLEETQTDGRLPVTACKMSPKLSPRSGLHSGPLWATFSAWLSWLLSALFHSALCVKGWLEGYNLEETWDPITDTNIPSLHVALSPPLSHMLASAAGLCLPGTRQPACLSLHISFFYN